MDGSGYVIKLSCHVKTVSKIVEKLGWITAEYNFENPKEDLTDIFVGMAHLPSW
jgi:hypothetical protein